MSGTWTISPVEHAPDRMARPRLIGSVAAGTRPGTAMRREGRRLPTLSPRATLTAPQQPHGALDDGVEDGCRSVGELEMTRRISRRRRLLLERLRQLAVPRLELLKSRTFSIAITAWSAKVRSSAISASVKGRPRTRRTLMRPDAPAFPQQRHDGEASGTPSATAVARPARRPGRLGISYVSDLSSPDGALAAFSSSRERGQVVANPARHRPAFPEAGARLHRRESPSTSGRRGPSAPPSSFEALFTIASKHRLGIRRRTADHPQDLPRRRLLLQRLGQLAVPRLELLEEPHVLDRDHRLVGEGLEELDLLAGEGPGLAAPRL